VSEGAERDKALCRAGRFLLSMIFFFAPVKENHGRAVWRETVCGELNPGGMPGIKIPGYYRKVPYGIQ